MKGMNSRSVGWGVTLAIAVVFAVIRWQTFQGIEAEATLPEYGDQVQYVELSRVSIFSGEFYYSFRPPGYPLLIHPFDGHLESIFTFQAILGIVSGLFLLLCVSLVISNEYVRVLGLVAAFFMLLAPPYVAWDKITLTESTNVSLSFLIASLLLLQQTKKLPRPLLYALQVLLGLILFLWGSARMANSYWLVMLVVYLVFLVVWFRLRLSFLFVAFVALVSLYFTMSSSNATKGYMVSFENAINYRVLNDEGRLKYFIDRGMPFDPVIQARTERPAWAGENLDRMNLIIYRAWLRDEGQPVYVSYLLSHPLYLFLEPIFLEKKIVPHHGWASTLPELFERNMMDNDFLARIHYPEFLHRSLIWFYTIPFPFVLACMFFFASCGLLLFFVWRRESSPLLFPLFAVVSSYPFLLIIWHGDFWDVWRHSIGALQFFYFGCWGLLFIGADIVIRSNSNTEEK